MLGWIACLITYIFLSVLTTSSYRIAALKCFIMSLIDSDCSVLTWNILVTLCFLLIDHIYRVTNFSDKARTKVIELGGRWWNHDKAGPTRLDGNTLHKRASLPLWSVMT